MASASHAAAVQLLIRPSTAANRSVRAWPGGTAPRSGATQGAWGRGLAPSGAWGGRRFYGQSLVFPTLVQIRIKTLNFQSIAFSLSVWGCDAGVSSGQSWSRGLLCPEGLEPVGLEKEGAGT